MILSALREDIANILEKDPAAKSALEVLLCYPGLHALVLHRIAHRCWHGGLRAVGRWVSTLARFLTGIEIHPGATIGRRVFIDHGMGVVIGETAEVGDDCTIYQGVTLGGTSLANTKRHPTLERGVVVSAGAKVLGPFTVGAFARIGSNAVVLRGVPAGATAVGIPARVVVKDTAGSGVATVSPTAVTTTTTAHAPSATTEPISTIAFSAYALTQGADDPITAALQRLIEHVAEQDRQIARLQQAVVENVAPVEGVCRALDCAALTRMVE